MGTTQQELYTNALHALGDRKFLTSENVTAINALNNVYTPVLEECLSKASWNFGMETIKVDADTGIDPDFGYEEVFNKPTDWVRTHALSDSEYFVHPLLNYYDEQEFWYADVTPIYVRYVSSDTGAGMELARWPRLFSRYVELSLADRVCMRLTQNASLKDRLQKDRKMALTDAVSADSMNDANPKFAPAGAWTRSRSSRTGRHDRGRRNSFTG